MIVQAKRKEGAVLKSQDGVRITILCGWCRKETKLRVGTVRNRLKNSSLPLFCSQKCARLYQTFTNDKKKYGARPAQKVR
jgi:hypothetical protein